MKRKLLTLFLAICMICTLVPFSAFAAENTETVSYEVTYNQSAARKMLSLINELRTGDDAWVKDKTSLIPIYKDLEELTYDYSLEKIAMKRAAEIAIYMDHTRPNGKGYETLIDKSFTASAENLAAGLNSYKEAFNGWLQTNAKYAGQAQRRNMLSENFNAVGISCAYYNGNYYWVQVFGKTATPNTKSTAAIDSATLVSTEINYDLIESIKISTDADTPVSVGMDKPAELPALTTTIIMDESWPGSDSPVIPEYTWATSDRSVVKISNGQLVGVKEGIATLTATALGTSYNIPVQVVAQACPFKDVEKGSYCYDAVLWAVDEGITKGIDKTHFAPDDVCTRGQIVTFLWREAGQPAPKLKKCPFKDVEKGSFCYDAVLWAVENGITNGTDKTHFDPDGECTRGQIVTFLWRSENEPAHKLKKCPFKDVEKGSFCYDAVLWAVENEITNGKTATTFAPKDTCTRGEIVTFLYRK